MGKLLSQKLKELRKVKNITQKQLAEEIGTTESSIRNYEMEKNPRKPTPYMYEKLSNFFEVPIEYLMYDSIKNTTQSNISIEKELGLSDKSISKIKEIKELGLSEPLNFFIENIDFVSYISKFDTILLCCMNINITIQNLRKFLYIEPKNIINMSEKERKNLQDYFYQEAKDLSIVNEYNILSTLTGICEYIQEDLLFADVENNIEKIEEWQQDLDDNLELLYNTNLHYIRYSQFEITNIVNDIINYIVKDKENKYVNKRENKK